MSKPKREIQRPRLKYKEGMSKDEIQKIAKAFGLRLREAREEKGKTQEELADAVGLKSAIVSMYERGERTPPWSTVLFLAKALKIDVAFFLTDGPTWHVLSTEQTETYIVERDLATQATLAGTGLIRQLGTRLPLRVMNEVYSKAHAEEMPDARMQKALQGICDGHRSAMENTIQTAPKSALLRVRKVMRGEAGDPRRGKGSARTLDRYGP